MGQEVIIEKAKAEWAHEFEAEKQQLADVLGKKVLAIETNRQYLCSRLAAKPVLDLMAGVSSLSEASVGSNRFRSSAMSTYFTKPSQPGVFFERESGGRAHAICTYTFFKAKNGKIS